MFIRFSSFQLRIEEAIDIQREQLSLNQQLHLVNLKLSFLFPHFHAILHSVGTIFHISVSYKFSCHLFVFLLAEDSRSFCRNMFSCFLLRMLLKTHYVTHSTKS